jgi:hypothetical protein
MKSSVDVQCGFDAHKGGDYLRLMKEWPERSRALRSQLSYLSAKYVLKEMLELIPKKDDFKAYRMALQVAQIRGADAEDDAFAVRVDARHRRVKRVDVPKVVLYVKPLRRPRRVKEEVKVLEMYNPWTYATLPFTPAKADANVVARKVSRAEVEKVTTSRKKDLPKVTRALARAGRREVKKTNRIKFPKRMQKVPEVIFEAAKMEFGLGTDRSKPHWKPSIKKLIRSGLRELRRKEPKLTWTLTRPGFQGWRKWPTKTRRQIRMAEVALFRQFQKRLGIRP